MITAGMWNVYHPTLHRDAELIAEFSQSEGHDSDYAILKQLSHRTNIVPFFRFIEYYQGITRLFQRPVAIYMEHSERVPPRVEA